MYVQAHEHSYERLFPVFNYEVLSFDYINPKVRTLLGCTPTPTTHMSLTSPDHGAHRLGRCRCHLCCIVITCHLNGRLQRDRRSLSEPHSAAGRPLECVPLVGGVMVASRCCPPHTAPAGHILVRPPGGVQCHARVLGQLRRRGGACRGRRVDRAGAPWHAHVALASPCLHGPPSHPCMHGCLLSHVQPHNRYTYDAMHVSDVSLCTAVANVPLRSNDALHTTGWSSPMHIGSRVRVTVTVTLFM